MPALTFPTVNEWPRIISFQEQQYKTLTNFAGVPAIVALASLSWEAKRWTLFLPALSVIWFLLQNNISYNVFRQDKNLYKAQINNA